MKSSIKPFLMMPLVKYMTRNVQSFCLTHVYAADEIKEYGKCVVMPNFVWGNYNSDDCSQ